MIIIAWSSKLFTRKSLSIHQKIHKKKTTIENYRFLRRRASFCLDRFQTILQTFFFFLSFLLPFKQWIFHSIFIKNVACCSRKYSSNHINFLRIPFQCKKVFLFTYEKKKKISFSIGFWRIFLHFNDELFDKICVFRFVDYPKPIISHFYYSIECEPKRINSILLCGSN